MKQRSFAQVLAEMEAGVIHDELTEELAELVQGVLEHGKAGSLTLKLSLKPNGANSIHMIADVKCVKPKPRKQATLFFADEGALMRDDPRQSKMELQSVDIETGEVRKV